MREHECNKQYCALCRETNNHNKAPTNARSVSRIRRKAQRDRAGSRLTQTSGLPRNGVNAPGSQHRTDPRELSPSYASHAITQSFFLSLSLFRFLFLSTGTYREKHSSTEWPMVKSLESDITRMLYGFKNKFL